MFSLPAGSGLFFCYQKVFSLKDCPTNAAFFSSAMRFGSLKGGAKNVKKKAFPLKLRGTGFWRPSLDDRLSVREMCRETAAPT
jgi:hypothetical protein